MFNKLPIDGHCDPPVLILMSIIAKDVLWIVVKVRLSESCEHWIILDVLPLSHYDCDTI